MTVKRTCFMVFTPIGEDPATLDRRLRKTITWGELVEQYPNATLLHLSEGNVPFPGYMWTGSFWRHAI